MIADLLSEPESLGRVARGVESGARYGTSDRAVEPGFGECAGPGGVADFAGAGARTLKRELRKMLERVEFGKATGQDGCGRGRTRSGCATELQELPELVEKLARAVVEDPPMTLKDGGIFRDGFDADLDELRRASRQGKTWITELQEREIASTGIKSLKVRFNSVFGYFIEITKSNLAGVPAHYTRKQTTVGGERFITPELKEMEAQILGADERSAAAGVSAFPDAAGGDAARSGGDPGDRGGDRDAGCALRAGGNGAAFSLRAAGARSSRCGLEIRDGRHPVLDQNLAEEKFVPNDTSLDGAEMRLAIITGPNMAGKSTYIRQVALIVLMAQIGSFVPAASARIGLVDRIFTRVGANDDLSRGQSTFMVEMNETANIVNNATERSLVILDEIGRGTSTFDGLSIAWSVAEFLHDKIKARTLFATHYHELTKLAEERKGVCNFNVAVREWNEQIIFLRKIVPGGADRSYGIQVARLAGLPKEILDRAKDILAHLESAERSESGSRPKKARRGKRPLRYRRTRSRRWNCCKSRDLRYDQTDCSACRLRPKKN